MWRIPFTALAFALTLSSAAPLHAQFEGDASTAPPVIEFHSGFWVNLHHFLYLEARRRGSSEAREAFAQPEFTPAAPAGELTPTEQTAWSAAVDAYSKDWAERNLL